MEPCAEIDREIIGRWYRVIKKSLCTWWLQYRTVFSIARSTFRMYVFCDTHRQVHSDFLIILYNPEQPLEIILVSFWNIIRFWRSLTTIWVRYLWFLKLCDLGEKRRKMNVSECNNTWCLVSECNNTWCLAFAKDTHKTHQQSQNNTVTSKWRNCTREIPHAELSGNSLINLPPRHHYSRHSCPTVPARVWSARAGCNSSGLLRRRESEAHFRWVSGCIGFTSTAMSTVKMGTFHEKPVHSLEVGVWCAVAWRRVVDSVFFFFSKKHQQSNGTRKLLSSSSPC
jgi:hypothetical protein